MFHTALQPLSENGVEALASLAMRATGAEGYALLEFDSRGVVSRRSANGITVDVPSGIAAERGLTIRNDVAVVSYPLRSNDVLVGLAAFAFRDHPIEAEKLALLDRIVADLKTLCTIPRTTLELAARIASLDAQLAGLKIAERTRGLLTDGAAAENSLDIVQRHVERVLQGRELPDLLNRLLACLEDEIEQRRLLAQAKVRLEEAGMSEEDAYLFLRNRSRTTRTRMGVIAKDILEGRLDAEEAKGWPRDSSSQIRRSAWRPGRGNQSRDTGATAKPGGSKSFADRHNGRAHEPN